MEGLKELLFRLCRAPGASGREEAAVEAARKELEPYGEAGLLPLGSLYCVMGDKSSSRRILLDAHVDQVGMIVTSIDKEGFLRVAPCGGIDRRAMPGSPVTVYGRETLPGIVCCMPPHLSKGRDTAEEVEKLAVDIGLSRSRAEELVSPGDRILPAAQPRSLMGTRVAAPGLDDRAGAAVLIRCAQLLKGESLPCVTILLSTREEIGGQGARTAAFELEPTEALAVDVSFASQPGIPPAKCGELGAGPMVGIAPVLDRGITQKLIAVAEKSGIPFQREVMAGTTGTNADGIIISRAGTPCGLVSAPLRYMHTPVEVVDIRDIDAAARLLRDYIRCDG